MASYLSVLIQAAEPANYKLNYDEHYLLSVPLATTTTPGIASFDDDYFSVENGVVTLSEEYAGNLNNILSDIADLLDGKVDKVVPDERGIYAYVVRKGAYDSISNYAIEISQDADADTIARRYTGGRLKVGNGVDNADAVNKGQLTAATTDIPKSALAASVQASLEKADTAYQKPSAGIPETDLTSAVRTKLNEGISRVGISPADWEALPVADRDINTWYFVGPYGTAPNQYFVEYVYFVKNDVGVWEPLGSTLAVDLSGYVQKLNPGEDGIYAYITTKAGGTTTNGGLKVSAAAEQGIALRGVGGRLKGGDAEDDFDLVNKQTMTAALANKANIDGVYSGMSVGHADIADQINTDREIEDADVACPPVVFGTVGGAAEVQNGYMRFPELRGHTIKWNQLVQNGNFADTTSWSTQNATLSASDNVASFTASAQYGQIKQFRNLQNGHKYLLKISIKLTTATTSVLAMFSAGSEYHYKETQATTTWQDVTIIASAGQSGSFTYCVRDDRASDWDEIQVKNAQLFDLTDIYGAGNEPSTVAEFVRDFPMPYYQYNAGTLLSSKSSSVDFIKRNQWDEIAEVGTIDDTTGQDSPASNRIRSKNYIPVLPNTVYFAVTGGEYYLYPYFYDGAKNYIGLGAGAKNGTITVPANAAYMRFIMQNTYGTTYNNDICVYINWETPGLTYVAYSKQHITLPNIELRSAGSTYDVLYQQGGGKRRIGTVDLGTLSYTKTTSTGGVNNYFYTSVIDGLKPASSNTSKANLLCAIFDTTTHGGNYSGDNIGIAATTTGVLSISGTAYNSMTEAQFKTAMSGVMLYYELATETDITVEENPGWTEYAEIDNFGTVKFNQDPAQTVPVPQAYFVRYTVNLVEFLDSLYVHCGGDVSKIALVSP